MSDIVELSLVVTKASFDKSEPDKNKKRRILMTSSDTSPDLYDESMSLELFQDFCRHIENNDPIPEQFKSVVCEESWCGGMPYISIAHYPAGKDGKNVPGTIESVYIDGTRLKSKAYLHDSPLGRSLFDSLCDDLEKRSKGIEDHKPVRVSIGFLDLEHVHIFEGKTITFTRTEIGQKCPLCKDGTGSKIYKKGYLVHEATTRVPVNPRTSTDLEEKSMDEIITKKDDAASIVGEELASELEAKSQADGVLVIRSEDLEMLVSQVRSAFWGKFMPPAKPVDPDPYLVTVLDDSVIAELDGKLYKVGYSKDGTDIKFDEKKSWVEVAYGFVPKSKVLWERSTTSNVPQPTPFASCYDPNTDSFDQSCIDASMRGFMAAIRNEMNTVKSDAVDRLTDEVAKSLERLQGKPVVEESMDKEHEKEETVAEEKKEEAAKEEKSEVSPLDQAYESLKSLLGANPTAEQIQAAFNQVGVEVEKAFTPAPQAPAPTDIAEIVKSAVEQVMTPVRVELATLRSIVNGMGAGVPSQEVMKRNANLHPVSRALTLKPEELTQKSQPTRKLTQIEMIARKSTGASVE